MARNLIGKIKKQFTDFSKTETTPHSIAWGFTIGTFIAITPTAGLDLLVAFFLALIFKKLNKISLFGAMVLWNPLTMIPIHILSYKIGSYFFSPAPVVKYNIFILDKIYNFSVRYLAGNLILAVVISTLSYFATYYIVVWYRKRHKKASSSS